MRASRSLLEFDTWFCSFESYLRSFGSAGDEEGELSFPYSCCVVGAEVEPRLEHEPRTVPHRAALPRR